MQKKFTGQIQANLCSYQTYRNIIFNHSSVISDVQHWRLCCSHFTTSTFKKCSAAAFVVPIAQLPVEHMQHVMTDRNHRAGGGKRGFKYQDFSHVFKPTAQTSFTLLLIIIIVFFSMCGREARLYLSWWELHTWMAANVSAVQMTYIMISLNFFTTRASQPYTHRIIQTKTCK